MFPLIFIIIVSVFVYRTARDNGYNAVLWTVATAVGFFVVQFAFAFVLGIIFVAGSALWGWSPMLLEDYEWLISLGGLAPAIVYVWLIWRYVNVIRDDGTRPAGPPPPPTFGSDDGPG